MPKWTEEQAVSTLAGQATLAANGGKLPSETRHGAPPKASVPLEVIGVPPLPGMAANGQPLKVSVKLSASKDVMGLNRLEQAWLEVILGRGYQWVGVQNLTLKLADDTRYTPDFMVVEKDGTITCFETKGFMRDDANVKIKVAARHHSWARFVLVTRKDKIWTEKVINP